MNISIKKIGFLLLLLFTYTVNTQLFSQRIKNTLEVSVSSNINGNTGSIEFTFENGKPPYQIVVTNQHNQYIEKTYNNNLSLKNIALGYYTIAISDTNSNFHVNHIDLK